MKETMQSVIDDTLFWKFSVYFEECLIVSFKHPFPLSSRVLLNLFVQFHAGLQQNERFFIVENLLIIEILSL